MAPHKAHILIIDDDKELSGLIKKHLTAEHYQVNYMNNGAKGVMFFQTAKIDLILIDIVMPELNGIEAAKAIRHHNQDVPIIFLTSQSDIQTKLEGFRAGADDYLIKPFNIDELTMRIGAILRRKSGSIKKSEIHENSKLGIFTFDYQNRELKSPAQTKLLSIKEADLLKILFDNIGELVKRDTILTYVWGKVDDYAANSMDVYLSRLRKLLKEDSQIMIENLHGTGYKLHIHNTK
ncbi:MAG: response regulator transcription factor [Bacteroidota bacterium]